MENVFDTITMQAAHEKAITAGKKAAQAVSNTYFGGGDGGACGFSWVTAEKTRANSKQGKALDLGREMFRNGPCQSESIECRRTSAQLIDNHERVLLCGLKNRRCFEHLCHERRHTSELKITCTHTTQHSAENGNRGAFTWYEATHLCENCDCTCVFVERV